MRVSEMKESKYLTAEGMKDSGPRVLTIDAIRKEKMNDGKEKWVMSFREVVEGWVLNITNLNILAELFGDETDDWERQKVELYADRVPFGKDMVWGIRCRLPTQKKPNGQGSRRTAPPMTQAEADMPMDDGWEPGRE